jgi:hypothetical protein
MWWQVQLWLALQLCLVIYHQLTLQCDLTFLH